MFCGKICENPLLNTSAINDAQTQSYEELLDLSGKRKSLHKLSKFLWWKYINPSTIKVRLSHGINLSKKSIHIT